MGERREIEEKSKWKPKEAIKWKLFFLFFWVPLRNRLPRGEHRAARRHKQSNPVFWVFNELPGGDEHPPGDVSQFGSILVFWSFWVDFVRGKR